MTRYQLIVSESFNNSLSLLVQNWEKELYLSDETINRFVSSIYQACNQLKVFPQMYPDVSDLYEFDQPTHRILIGKSYAIFYRITSHTTTVTVGNIFSQKQLKVKF